MNLMRDPESVAKETSCNSAALVDPQQVRTHICSSVAVIADAEDLPIAAARGRVLAENIRSRHAVPRFDNAAMDGFAIHAEDLESGRPVRMQIADGLHPGDRHTNLLCPGTAVPVTTGAPIPAGTGAVIAFERTASIDRNIILVPHMPNFGTNIRRVAEDTSADEVIAALGTVIDARHIALMAAAGVSRVCVRRKLRTCVISTGSELVEIGSTPAVHQIIDVNRPALMALLDEPAIERFDGGIVADNPDAVRLALAAASHHDLIITSGGVSGSDTDHVAAALVAAGGQAHTFKLAIKPGKPLLIGTIRAAHVLGLAGNPVSAIVSFLLFGRPLARALLGAGGLSMHPLPARTACDFPHRSGRTEYVPVQVEGIDSEGFPRLRRLGRGGSARLSPLAAADGLAEIDGMTHDLSAGCPIRFHPFSALLAD